MVYNLKTLYHMPLIGIVIKLSIYFLQKNQMCMSFDLSSY